MSTVETLRAVSLAKRLRAVQTTITSRLDRTIKIITIKCQIASPNLYELTGAIALYAIVWSQYPLLWPILTLWYKLGIVSIWTVTCAPLSAHVGEEEEPKLDLYLILQGQL